MSPILKPKLMPILIDARSHAEDGMNTVEANFADMLGLTRIAKPLRMREEKFSELLDTCLTI
ncbi:hypothetical protein BCON_0274g00140 [Botryotinia convoluta]|uniref:Uncharacterized protein n=1 Tax=Botryotinia convoluta TaxID=54673 RepID=A0A4Z1HFH9_9HELO|nr:hypothetical protein BCON_0274g00140 [Botryotinia convoluta]